MIFIGDLPARITLRNTKIHLLLSAWLLVHMQIIGNISVLNSVLRLCWIFLITYIGTCTVCEKANREFDRARIFTARQGRRTHVSILGLVSVNQSSIALISSQQILRNFEIINVESSILTLNIWSSQYRLYTHFLSSNLSVRKLKTRLSFATSEFDFLNNVFIAQTYWFK